MNFFSQYIGEFGKRITGSIDLIAVLIIVWGFIKTLALYAAAERELLNTKKSFNSFHSVRQELASYLLLSLEFVIAGDIIHTITDPTMNNILLLGLIVIIRTAISFILERELRQKKTK